ncbi:hypothetical protein BIY24_09355 [Halobacteriovorax marinus]|uniref:hypothetical protein n=1 Tax=Halobacteriovorax marinus TaxID=97084 RepID=UPI000BC2C5F8|nr:hypothetical protein [Halobacteriovorax marinus]ATH08147.1 hypothetical protein BIY24_09355 [Halobacteriovorax marinus]
MKTLFLSLLLLCSFSINARGNFVDYSESFDVFQIVDGISQWREGAPKEYRAYYEEKFSLSSADKEMLGIYKALREKYHKAYPKAQGSIFSDVALSADILSRTFASYKTLDRSLLTLKKKKLIEVEDIKTLVKIYKHFKKNISTIVRESSLLAQEAKRLESILKKSKVTNNIKKLDRFFDLPTNRIVGGRIKLVWWPQTDRPSIDFQAGRVILRMNPIKHAKLIDEEFLTQMLIHSLIISQGKTNKENFSKVFLENCSKIKDKDLAKDLWFEVPLIEALSKYYLPAAKLKKKFNPYTVKAESPWVDVYSKYLFGLVQYSVKNRVKFDRQFIATSANYCQSLLNL